jgi:hypothetical protein
MTDPYVTLVAAAKITGMNDTALNDACRGGRLPFAYGGKGNSRMMVRISKVKEAIAEGRLRIGKKRKKEV